MQFRQMAILAMLGVVASCAAPSYQIAQKNNGAQAQPVASQDGSRVRVGAAGALPERQALALRFVNAVIAEDVQQVTNSAEIDRLVDNLRKQHPATTDTQLTSFRQLITQKMPEMKQRIIEAMSRVYAEEFTLSELRQIVAFHESPTGRKLRSRNTALKDEVKQAAQEEGRKAAIELLTPLLIQWALEAKGQVS